MENAINILSEKNRSLSDLLTDDIAEPTHIVDVFLEDGEFIPNVLVYDSNLDVKYIANYYKTNNKINRNSLIIASEDTKLFESEVVKIKNIRLI